MSIDEISSESSGNSSKFLHPQAARDDDKNLIEREIPENKPEDRNDFQRDRDRIIHSKAFRRLMHKTQVFVSPDSEHFRTRMTHTLEVAQIARSIAKNIGAKEELTEAIALGHDLGHTPFGHKGQYVLDGLLKKYRFWFRHAAQSFRVVSYLEYYPRFEFGQGLNLTRATRAGILRHSSVSAQNPDEKFGKFIDLKGKIKTFDCPETLEEKIVRIADDIAWANHDWDDGVRAGILSNSLLGKDILAQLGCFQGERINKLVQDLEKNFRSNEELKFSPDKEGLFKELQNRLTKYLQHSTAIERGDGEINHQIKTLFELFMENPVLLPQATRERRRVYVDNHLNSSQKRHNALVIADFISGMTDDYFTATYRDLFCFSRRKLRETQSADWIKIEEVISDKKVSLDFPENLSFADLKKDAKWYVCTVEEGERRENVQVVCKGIAKLLNEKEAEVYLEEGRELEKGKDVLILE